MYGLTHFESTPLDGNSKVSARTNHGPHQGAALMKRTTKYVALDVHQATTVASVREDSGRIIAARVLRQHAGSVHVTFEEGRPRRSGSTI